MGGYVSQIHPTASTHSSTLACHTEAAGNVNESGALPGGSMVVGPGAKLGGGSIEWERTQGLDEPRQYQPFGAELFDKDRAEGTTLCTHWSR